MLPLYLLTNAKGQKMIIELKSGETIEGELTNVDNWMNLTLTNVVQICNNEKLELPEIYLRGSFVKYIKLQDDIIEKVKHQINNNSNNQQKDGRRRGGIRNFDNMTGQKKRFDDRRNGGNRRENQSNWQNRSRGPSNNGIGGSIQYHQQHSQISGTI